MVSEKIEPFIVKIKVQPHVLFSQGIIPVSIKAFDEFKRPIQGTANLQCMDGNVTIFQTQFNIYGKGEIDIDMAKDLGLTRLTFEKQLNFKVTVQESQTGNYYFPQENLKILNFQSKFQESL